MAYDFDVIVIGAGPAGLTAAKTAAAIGKRVALIEKDKLGGSCTWSGCVPSKTLIKSAETAYFVQQFKKRGLQGTCEDIDSSFVMNHVRETIERIYQADSPEIIKKLGITVLSGTPELLNNHQLQVNSKTISFSKMIVATGSRPCIPPIEGIDSVDYLTNETFFNLKKLPRSMIILGGGPIGCELASALNRLGVKITIIEFCAQILAKDDPECAAIVAGCMRAEGVTIHVSCKAQKVAQAHNSVIVTYSNEKNESQEVSAESLFIATGRIANSDGIGLEKIGVATQRSFITANCYLQTSASNIYACGDVTGPYLFSHMAWHQGVTAGRNASIPLFKKKMNYDELVWVTFTAPEIASVGLNEQQARDQYGNGVEVFSVPYNKLDRAIMDANEIGLAKFICDRSGNLLGAQIVGERAGEIISTVQIALKAKLNLARLSSTIFPYPTYGELLWHASKMAYLSQLNKSFLIMCARFFFGKNEKK